VPGGANRPSPSKKKALGFILGAQITIASLPYLASADVHRNQVGQLAKGLLVQWGASRGHRRHETTI